MHLDQRDVGGFRIYAGALDAPMIGFSAEVVVVRIKGGRKRSPTVVYRNERVQSGRVFKSPEDALRAAFDTGHAELTRRFDIAPSVGAGSGAGLSATAAPTAAN